MELSLTAKASAFATEGERRSPARAALLGSVFTIEKFPISNAITIRHGNRLALLTETLLDLLFDSKII
jgi:hypothetical protein